MLAQMLLLYCRYPQTSSCIKSAVVSLGAIGSWKKADINNADSLCGSISCLGALGGACIRI